MSNELKKLAMDIFSLASKESEVLPIDRNFVLPYLDEILNLSGKGFIIENFQEYPESYVHTLFINAFEIWWDFSLLDWIEIGSQLKGRLVILNFVAFTRKYLGVDGRSMLNISDEELLFLQGFESIYFQLDEFDDDLINQLSINLVEVKLKLVKEGALEYPAT